jgi:hypothetical protein
MEVFFRHLMIRAPQKTIASVFTLPFIAYVVMNTLADIFSIFLLRVVKAFRNAHEMLTFSFVCFPFHPNFG